VVSMSPDGCRVVAGLWVDRFTGERFTDPSRLDIDHMVPLANAHRSTGALWPREHKQAFANDLTTPDALVAVSASANRSKGDRSPDQWKPPDADAWCWYATVWVTVKVTWDLTVTTPERGALSDMLQTC
jgi:hypothetical protein